MSLRNFPPGLIVTSSMLVVVSAIHLLPLSGALGGGQLAALYGLDFEDPNLAILMRHRAVLFGLLGAFLLVAAFRPAWHGIAFLAGSISVVSFLGLAWSLGGFNASLARVVMADLVALTCLIVGVITHFLVRRRS